MSARKFSNIFMPRFRNKSDALEFMECIRTEKPLRKEVWVCPFIRIGDAIVINPEYRDAPFECQYI